MSYLVCFCAMFCLKVSCDRQGSISRVGVEGICSVGTPFTRGIGGLLRTQVGAVSLSLSSANQLFFIPHVGLLWRDLICYEFVCDWYYWYRSHCLIAKPCFNSRLVQLVLVLMVRCMIIFGHRDVTKGTPLCTPQPDGLQNSFWLGETLKYVWLVYLCGHDDPTWDGKNFSRVLAFFFSIFYVGLTANVLAIHANPIPTLPH